MKRRRCGITVCLAAALLPVLLISPAVAHYGMGYHYSHAPCASNPDWMADLPENLHVSQLSIPGTHDTYSVIEHSWSAHCQMMSLYAQLQSGIRAVDVRLNVSGDRLRTAHGIYTFWSYFEHVLADCIAFLEAHEGETILMRVKRNQGDPNRFVDLFKAYIYAPYEDTTYWDRWFWNPATSANPANPTVGEIRGKIVVMQDFPDTSGALYGLDYMSAECCACTDLPHTDCESDATIKIQDSYDMATIWSMGWKWEGIHRHLLRTDAGDMETIYVNYLSGSGGVFPYFVASGHTNPATGADHLWAGPVGWQPHYLRARCWPFWCYYYHGMNELAYIHIRDTRPKRAGIIMADFPGAGLIDLLIATNDSLFQANAPVALANGPYRAAEGSSIVFDAAGSSDPNGDPMLFRWDVNGDGSWDTDWSGDPTTSHTWYDNYCPHDPASHPVPHEDTVCVARLHVTDGEFTTGDRALVIISNRAPRVDIDRIAVRPGRLILPGRRVRFRAQFSDPGCLDTHSATWDFGDGAVVPGTLTREIACPDTTGEVLDRHAFDSPGSFSVVLEVEDSDRGVGRDTVRVRVLKPPEALDFLDDFVLDLPDESFRGDPGNGRRALSDRFSALRHSLEAGDSGGVVRELKQIVRAEADALNDSEAGSDYIIDEDARARFREMIDELVEYLESSTDGETPPEATETDDSVLAPGGLSRNEPNPFSSSTTIKFSLPEPCEYRLDIHDATGRFVRGYSGFAGPGVVSVEWDCRNTSGAPVPSGVYFYLIETRDYRDTRKMLLVR